MKTFHVYFAVFLFLLISGLYAADSALPIIAAGQNSDGRLEIFYIKSNTLYHRWQTAPSGGWSDEAIFYEPTMGVAVERDSEGCLNALVIQPDHSLIHIIQSAPNSGWNDPVEMGETAKSVALIHDDADTLHLFYTNSENILYHKTHILPGKTWSERSVLAEDACAVAAGRNLDGRLEAFYSDSGDTLFHKWQNAPGGSWSDHFMFAHSAKQIEVTQNLDGRLEVFYIDQADVLYQKWQVAPSSGWEDPLIFADQAHAVTARRNEDGRLIILFTDENDILHYRVQIEPNSAWQSLEQFGWTAKGAAVALNADGRLEAVYLNMDDILFHNWQIEPGQFWAGEYPFLDLDQPLFTVDAYADYPIYTPSPGNWHVNDHCFIQGPDDRWHMYGIVWPDPGSGDPSIANYFGHASADSLTQPTWVEEDPPFYDSLEDGKLLWAPHIILYDNTYTMFYCNGGDVENFAIVFRTSEDLVAWSDPIFCFGDGYQGRDPMVMLCEEEEEWIMYYTATDDPTGGNFVVAYRTSEDLITWSDRQIVYSDYHWGTGYGPTESPFVVQRGDAYYLLIGPRPYDHPTEELPNWEHPGYVGTDVFRSERRDLWTNADYVGHIEAHAPEIVRDEDGDWFVSHSGIWQGGLYLAELTWLDGLDSEVEDRPTFESSGFSLRQNYPNPFNPRTRISYSVSKAEHVSLTVYNVLGEKVETLVDETQIENIYTVDFKTSDLTSGTYFYVLKIGNSDVETKKMILIR